MRQTLQPGPAFLLWTVTLSTLLVSVGFGYPVISTLTKAHAAHFSFQQRLLWGMLMLFGLVSSLAAERLLSNGIQKERWTERQLAPVRSVVRTSVVAVFSWALVACALVSVVIVHSSHANNIAWCFFAPCLSLNRLRSIFKQPQDTPSTGLSLGPASGMQIVRSDRWGA